MGAIAAHFRYISKSGRLTLTDDRGVEHEGKDAVRDLADQWRHGGSFIDEISHRREAFNIMLSMPSGTDAQSLKVAAQEFARVELAGHRWVMVLHEHQANPHVHLSVRAEGLSGRRLNPRKAGLQRWRDTFAEKLRDRGIDADSTRQFVRGVNRQQSPLWRIKAREEGRLRTVEHRVKAGEAYDLGRRQALTAWAHLVNALEHSETRDDRTLATNIRRFVGASTYFKEIIDRARSGHGADVASRARESNRHAVPHEQSKWDKER